MLRTHVPTPSPSSTNPRPPPRRRCTCSGTRKSQEHASSSHNGTSAPGWGWSSPASPSRGSVSPMPDSSDTYAPSIAPTHPRAHTPSLGTRKAPPSHPRSEVSPSPTSEEPATIHPSPRPPHRQRDTGSPPPAGNGHGARGSFEPRCMRSRWPFRSSYVPPHFFSGSALIPPQLMLVAMTYNVRPPPPTSHTNRSPPPRADIPLQRNHRRLLHRTLHVRIRPRHLVSSPPFLRSCAVADGLCGNWKGGDAEGVGVSLSGWATGWCAGLRIGARQGGGVWCHEGREGGARWLRSLGTIRAGCAVRCVLGDRTVLFLRSVKGRHAWCLISSTQEAQLGLYVLRLYGDWTKAGRLLVFFGAVSLGTLIFSLGCIPSIPSIEISLCFLD